jgi:hypothetical protein
LTSNPSTLPTPPHVIHIQPEGKITYRSFLPKIAIELNMLDPLSALSVAASAVQFLDFLGKVVGNTVKLYRAKNKKIPDSVDFNLQDLTKALVRHNDKLVQSIKSVNNLGDEEQELARLCEGCNRLAGNLITALQRLQHTGRNEIWESFVIALRAIWNEKEIDSMHRQLDSCRSQISMCIHFLCSVCKRTLIVAQE